MRERGTARRGPVAVKRLNGASLQHEGGRDGDDDVARDEESGDSRRMDVRNHVPHSVHEQLGG